MGKTLSPGSQSILPGPEASESPGNFLKFQFQASPQTYRIRNATHRAQLSVFEQTLKVILNFENYYSLRLAAVCPFLNK